MSVTAVIAANAVSPVGDHQGPCQLVLSQKSITISISAENGTKELGTWPFDCIRRFHSQDQCYFSFTSGRRGPFGVHDYTFQVKEEDLVGLQSKLTHFTGAKFDSPKLTRQSSGSRIEAHKISANHINYVPPPLPQSSSSSRQVYPHPYSHAHFGSVAPSSPTTKPISPTNIHEHPQPPHSYITTNVALSDGPTVVPKVPVSRNGHVPTGQLPFRPLGKQTSMKASVSMDESGSPSGRPPVKSRSAFTFKGTSTSHMSGAGQPLQPSLNGRDGRYTTTVRPSSPASPFQNQSSAFKQYSQSTLTQTAPPKHTNSTYHKDKQNTQRTPSPPQMPSVLTAVPRQPSQSTSPPLPRRYEEMVSSSAGRRGATSSPSLPRADSYDTLSDAREASSQVRTDFSGSYSPRRSESPKSSEEEADSAFSPVPGKQSQTKNVSLLERRKISDIDGVELRNKKSPTPSRELDFSNLDKGTRLPPTKTEMRQLKKLAREPLINVSDFTQRRRNADYVDIDLPENRSSDSFSERSDSVNSSLYSVPSSLPASSSAEQVYDIPTSANPGNAGTRPVVADGSEHYDVPQSALAGGSSRLSAQIVPVLEGHYDTPRIAAIRRSKSPPQRALPHLPDDYVNIVPGQFKRQISGKSKSESGAEEGDGLYSEIPAVGPVWGVKVGRVSSAGKLTSTSGAQNIDIYSDFVDTPDAHSGLKRFSQMESQLQGEKIAKKLADAGYEFFRPANIPAVVSPPAERARTISPFSPTLARSSCGSPPLENVVPDEYMELQRQDIAVTDENYMNIPSGQTTKQGKDGYEVVEVSGLKMTSPGGAKPQQQPSVESDSKYAASSSTGMENTRRMEIVQQQQPQGPTRSAYVNVGVGSKSRKNDGYEEVKDRFPNTPLVLTLSRKSSPPQSQPQVTPANQATTTKSPSKPPSISSTADANLKRKLSEVGDMLEDELVDEDTDFVSPDGHIPVENTDDEYIVMKSFDSEYIVMQSPVVRTNSTGTTSSSGSPEPSELAVGRPSTQSTPIAIPEKLLIPTAAGSPIVGNHPPRHRKRSLTVGDPLDGVVRETKKHTYINITPDQSMAKGFSPPRSCEDSSVEDKLIPDKKPMPLPRQSSLKQGSPPLVDRHQDLIALHQNSKTLPSIPLHRNGDKNGHVSPPNGHVSTHNGHVSPPNGHVEMESSNSKVQSIIRQFSGNSSSPPTSPCTSPKTRRKS